MMQFTVVLGAIVAIGTILYGVRAMKRNQTGNLKKAIATSTSLFGLAVIGLFAFIAMGSPVFAAETTATAVAATSGGEGLKYLAAALSTGIATVATGMAVSSVGSSAIGAISEDPSILGKTLIFVGMAEGIAIYGMIISILILFV